MTLSDTFRRFQDSEAAGGYVLIACTLIALAAANSPAGPAYVAFWKTDLGGLSLGHWVNDALMAIFFLLIGLELEREIYVGELSDARSALLPACAAIGGMVVPALVHVALNAGSATQAGFGIPMATDIAFALAVLALLGRRVPPALKVFVVAFAVMDDLGAIVIIAVAYSGGLSLAHLAGALAVLSLLAVMNRSGRAFALAIYLALGALLWFLLLRSGVHATLAGVVLAFSIPFGKRGTETESLSHRLENRLHKPVAFLVLPLFALANTGIVLDGDALRAVASTNAAGIAAGLLLGKPVGVMAACALAVACGIGRLPEGVGWSHLVGAGLLGGIGFTMSIFIANLAFAADPVAVDASKFAVLLASLAAGFAGYFWLRIGTSPKGGG